MQLKKLVLGWIALMLGIVGNVYLAMLPNYERMLLRESLLTIMGVETSTVWLGDSILESVRSPSVSTRNLAVSGATSTFVRDELLATTLRMQPARIVIGVGINDLRWGAHPASVSYAIGVLLAEIEEVLPASEVIVLAVLPLARDTNLGGETDIREIRELNILLNDMANANGVRFVDHTRTFTDGVYLAEHLTTDGLHLNAAGQALYAEWLESH